DHPILELHDTSATRALGIRKLPTASFDWLQRSRDADCSLREIDVRPLQGKIFAGAHTCGQGESEEHVISMLLGGCEEGSGLLQRQHLNLTFCLAGQIDALGRVDRDEAPLDSLVQRGAQYCVRKPDGAS